MAVHYGIIDHGTLHSPSGRTHKLTLWSGPFMSTWEAEANARNFARTATFTDYSGEKFRVQLPSGVIFPRTEENFQQIDAAISAAYVTHNARLGRIQIGVTA